MLYNPAGQSTPGMAGISYNPYAGRFRYTTAAAMLDAGGGTAGIAIQYLDYGTMDGYTPGGDPTGIFSASSYAVNLNYSRGLGPFRYGANLKLAGTSIESYNAFGMGVDLGLSYKHPTSDFTAGVTLQNVGVTMRTFQGTSSRSWPVSVNAGAAYKFAHMPLRFYVTGQQLQQWDVVYLDPTYSVKIDDSGKEVPESKPWSEKLFRHTAIGAELILSKAFVVRGGYNHLLRKEMRIVNQASGAAGYSFGVGLAFRKFVFDYTHTFIGPAGGANYINLAYTFGKRADAPAAPPL